MTEIMPTYFDALPLHTQPEPFESLTSYLIRLAETNEITSIPGLTALCFPGQKKAATLRLIRDYPPISSSALQKMSGCPEARLLQTTYYHLGKKFGRSTQRRLLTYFLSDSIFKSLRYCPRCLADHSYYSLLWRFPILKGCHKHCCRLFNECRHCGKAVSIISPLLRIRICPACNGDLSQCQPEPLTAEENVETLNFSQDIEFILTPQDWELTISSIAEKLGLEFRLLRQKENVSAESVKRILGIHPKSHVLRSVDLGIDTAGSFQLYMKYAKLLGTTLRNIFGLVLQRSEEDWDLERLRKSDSRSEDDLLKQLEQAADMLRSLGKQATQQEVSDIVHMSQVSLCKYPRVKEFFKQLSDELHHNRKKQKQFREKEILEKVQETTQHLEEQGKPVTRLIIAKSIGIHAPNIKNYPQVDMLIQQKAHQPCQQIQRMRQREKELLLKVEMAIQQMKSSRQKVTQRGIAKMVGVSLSTLKNYAQVRTILEQETDTASVHRRIIQMHQSEEKLTTQVEDAIRKLESSGQLVTQGTIAKLLGKRLSQMKRYPGTRALLEEQPLTDYPQLHSPLGEDELIAKVKMVIEEVEFPGEQALYTVIGSKVGVHPALLREYPTVTTLVEQAVRKQEQQRERMLLAKVERAVHKLKTLGQRITLTTIGSQVGLGPRNFHRYSSVITFVQEAARENKQETLAKRFQQREEELAHKVLEAIQQLQLRGQPLSAAAIAKYIHVGRSTLSRYPKVQHILDNIAITPGRPRKSH